MQERVLALENKLKEREAQTTQARCDSRGVPVQSHVDSLHRNAANLLYRVLPAGAADSRNSRSSDTQSHNSKRRKGIPRQGSEQRTKGALKSELSSLPFYEEGAGEVHGESSS